MRTEDDARSDGVGSTRPPWLVKAAALLLVEIERLDRVRAGG
jgi:hypothetical protein